MTALRTALSRRLQDNERRQERASTTTVNTMDAKNKQGAEAARRVVKVDFRSGAGAPKQMTLFDPDEDQRTWLLRPDSIQLGEVRTLNPRNFEVSMARISDRIRERRSKPDTYAGTERSFPWAAMFLVTGGLVAGMSLDAGSFVERVKQAAQQAATMPDIVNRMDQASSRENIDDVLQALRYVPSGDIHEQRSPIGDAHKERSRSEP